MRASRRSFAKAALGVAGATAFGAAACSDGGPPVASTSAVPLAIPAQRERPTSVLGIGAFVDLPALHGVLKDHHDTGLVTGGTWPSTAIALLGLPLLFSQYVDDAAPVRVLLVEGGSLLVAIPLRNADLALATATSGSTASWKREMVGAVEVLRRIDGARIGVTEAIGVCRNALLATTDATLFERAGDVALYASTLEAEGFAALTEKASPPRFGAVVKGSALRGQLAKSLEKLPPSASALALALSQFAFKEYDAADIPIGFTVDPGTAMLDVSLPDRAEHLGLSPIAASSLLSLPASTFAAAYGDRRGGAIDPALLAVLGSSFDSEAMKKLVAAIERRALGPVSLRMSHAPTGTAFVLRADVTKGASVFDALDALVSKEPVDDAGSLRVDKVVLTRIGEVHKITVGGAVIAAAVRGDALVVTFAAEPLVALVAALEPPSASVADQLPRALANRIPDPTSLALALDLDAFGGTQSARARKVGPRALVFCVFENEGRATLRASITAGGWRGFT